MSVMVNPSGGGMGKTESTFDLQLAVRETRLGCAVKRTFDVAFALLGLLLGMPLILVAAIAVKLDSPGPAFYTQERVGYRGRPFAILKLRTMCIDADRRLGEFLRQNESGGPTFKMRNDPRITRVGRLLRRTSIDELPQLWNILVGEMSVVGPRPNRPHEVAQYRPADYVRLEVKPGLTCLWQVRGRANAQFDAWMQYDREYLRRRSMWLDLWIIVQTAWVVLRMEGAY